MNDVDRSLRALRDHVSPRAESRDRVRRRVASALLAGSTAALATKTAETAPLTATGKAGGLASGYGAAAKGSWAIKLTIALTIGSGVGGGLWLAVDRPSESPIVIASNGASPTEPIADSAAKAEPAVTHPTETAALEEGPPPAESVSPHNQAPLVHRVRVAANPPEVAAAPAPSLESTSSQPAEARAISPPSRESQLFAELALLEDASKELRAGRREAAAKRLKEHERKYPNSSLGVERQGMRILATCESSSKTKIAAAAFVKAHSQSPLATHIRRRCLN